MGFYSHIFYFLAFLKALFCEASVKSTSVMNYFIFVNVISPKEVCSGQLIHPTDAYLREYKVSFVFRVGLQEFA